MSLVDVGKHVIVAQRVDFRGIVSGVRGTAETGESACRYLEMRGADAGDHRPLSLFPGLTTRRCTCGPPGTPGYRERRRRLDHIRRHSVDLVRQHVERRQQRWRQLLHHVQTDARLIGRLAVDGFLADPHSMDIPTRVRHGGVDAQRRASAYDSAT